MGALPAVLKRVQAWCGVLRSEPHLPDAILYTFGGRKLHSNVNLNHLLGLAFIYNCVLLLGMLQAVCPAPLSSRCANVARSCKCTADINRFIRITFYLSTPYELLLTWAVPNRYAEGPLE